MPKASPIKVSFNAGELSPLLDGRPDQGKYFNGCSILEGFLPTIQGPIIRRGGFYYSNETKFSDDRSWLRRFRFNVNQSYMLEFGDLYIRFFTNRGPVLEATKVITGITQATPGVVTSVAHGFVTGDVVYIAGVVGMTQANNKFYVVGVTAANTFQLLDIDGVNVNTSVYTAYASGGTAARVYQVVTPYAVADLTDSQGNFALKFEQQGDIMYMFLPGYQTQKLSHVGNTNWTVTPVLFDNGPFKDLNSDKTSTVYVSSYFTTAVTGAASSGGLIRIACASTTGLTTGMRVYITGITGTIEANGEWAVTVIDGTHFDLVGSVFTNAYTAGGTVVGAVGTPITITASSSIFVAGHIGTQFYFEQSPVDGIKQWEVGKSIAAGDRRRSGFNNYIALNAATTGSSKPVHTEGAVYDGDTGVQWLYLDSGFGAMLITSQGGTTATGTVIAQPPFGSIGTGKKTYIWAHSLFSSVEGWPERGRIWKERLTMAKGIELAGSVSGDYENFARKIGGVVTTDSAFRIVAPTTDPIRWLMDAGDLLLGTGGNEIAVSKIASAQPVGPDNIEANKQTTYGSRNVEPVEVGNAVLFVTRSGKKLREIIFSFELSSYTSADVTVLSEHIARGADGMQGMVQINYQQEPYSIIWAVTTDGRLLGFTYNREQDVLAWHRHPVGSYSAQISGIADNGAGLIRLTVPATGGIVTGAEVIISGVIGTDEANGTWTATVVNATHIDLQNSIFTNTYESGGVVKSEAEVESVDVIPSPDGTRDDVWVIVKRTINGTTRRYVEWMVPEFMGTDAEIADAFYVDGGLTYDGVGTTTITGLDHLLGMIVDILADGGTHPQKIVTTLSPGVIGVVVDAITEKAQIGLPCPCKVRTMRLEAGSATGTAQGKLKIIKNMLLRVLNTLGGKFGATEEKMDPLIYREGDGLMDTPPRMSGTPVNPGDKNLDWPAGTDTEGFMMLVNDTPLPMTIITIAAKMETQDD